MRVIVFDTETTGLDHTVDRICEIGAVLLELDSAGVSATRFETLANPGRDIPPEAMATHHITQEMVADAPSPVEALEMMRAALGEPDYWVAHNLKFDIDFIEDLRPDLIRRDNSFCTYRCASHLWQDAPGHSNQVLRYWLGIRPSLPPDLAPHRALYDSICTAHILLEMLADHSVEELHEMSYRPVFQKRVRFGKHRGQDWSTVPRDYLQWVLKQSDMDPDARHTAKAWLDRQGSMI